MRTLALVSPLLAAPALFAAAPAAALPVPFLPPVTVAVTGGTLGVGPELTYRVNRLLAVRGSATFLGFDANGRVSGYRYDGNVRLRNFGGTVDIHPLPVLGFRLSAGVRSTSGNRIRFTGTSRGNQTYGGFTFTPEQAGTLSGRIETRDVSPILTLGYAHSGVSGFTYGIDAGVMFQGKPRVRDLVATGQLATNPAAQAERARQEQRLRDRADNYPYYPVLQISLGYRF